MKVSFHTLGCKVNFAESSTLAREFEAAGFERVEETATADVYVVNTCSVTAAADKKCRNLISRLHRQSPGAKIVVTGCYAQLAPERLAQIPGVDFVFGNTEKHKIVSEVLGGGATFNFQLYLSRKMPPPLSATVGARSMTLAAPLLGSTFNFYPAFSAGDRTRAFLKVQDGCDYKCTYCTIHNARGGSRNAPIAQVLEQARELAARGVREIVVTGVNTGDFGRTTGEKFADLVRALEGVEGVERYRISSIEPNLLTDEVIEICATSKKFQPHFHVPLQSGSDRILGLMRRRYTARGFAQRIERVKRAMPDAFIGVDVIVGFPGETDEDFGETRRLLEETRPAELHVFPYSARPGTPAAEMPGKVPPAVMAARAAMLGAMSRALHGEFVEKMDGKEAEVLWEAAEKEGTMAGWTGNYVRVTAPYDEAAVNTITKIICRVGENCGKGVHL